MAFFSKAGERARCRQDNEILPANLVGNVAVAVAASIAWTQSIYWTKLMVSDISMSSCASLYMDSVLATGAGSSASPS